MSERFSREILRKNVAQICQTIGWNSINSTPLDVMVHVLEKFIRNIGTQANHYSEQFNRTEPNLHDIGLVFRDLHINLPELNDYIKNVPPFPSCVALDKYPKPKEPNLNFLKPGSDEVVTRPVHIHEYLPAIYPEKETPSTVSLEINQNGIENEIEEQNGTCNSPEIFVTDSPEKSKDVFKRPSDPVILTNNKRPRLKTDGEEGHTREITSVMMTMSGFLSPAREGKLPEVKPPVMVAEKIEKHNEKHKINSHHSASKQSHEKSEKKSKKSKLVNGKIMKNKRKDKHRNDSKHKPDGKMDRLPLGFLPKHPIPSSQSRLMALAQLQSLPNMRQHNIPPPIIEPMRHIKQEPVECAPTPTQDTISDLNYSEISPLHGHTIPVPKLIPKHKSHLNNMTVPSPIIIKQEVINEDEKLSSQPDKSKVNIFKRINKVKDDKLTSDSVNLKHSPAIKSEFDSDLHKEKNHEVLNNNTEPPIDDFPKDIDLTTNEVISLDDDSIEFRPLPLMRPEKIPIDFIEPKKKPVLLDDFPTTLKPKKEKKHRDKKEKAALKAAKLSAKLLKKQALVAAQLDRKDMNLMSTKYPKSSKSRKNDKRLQNLPPGFPFFPNLQSTLIPGPGLLPNPLLPSADFFTNFANNPALRGLPNPHLLANPFALSGGPGLIPGPSFSQSSSNNLPNPILLSHLGPSSKPHKSHNVHPLLRRPSLEVIPVDNEENSSSSKKHSSVSPSLTIKEKHSKSPSIPNILHKHGSSHKTSKHTKDISPPKPNLIKQLSVQPDVTIELNPPQVKQEPVEHPMPKIIPPSPTPIPVPVPLIKYEPIESKTIIESLPATAIKKETDLEKIEKKKDKLHKKEKKVKDGIKHKKKKEKKDKKDKGEKKKEIEEKPAEHKEKVKKDKKEKKKDREKAATPTDAVVPKLTLKLGSASPMPPSSPEILKLNIKPIVKKEDESLSIIKEEKESTDTCKSPELAQISALVTRPPKQKHGKYNHTDQIEMKQEGSSNSPPRKEKKDKNHSSKYKKILFKPIKKKHDNDEEDLNSTADTQVAEPPPVTLEAPKAKPISLNTPYYIDDLGNKVWVCPACAQPDNGTSMIGCDGCDCWYHWTCVGITQEPGADEDWFCKACLAKRSAMVSAFAGVNLVKKRGRKPKSEKHKDGH